MIRLALSWMLLAVSAQTALAQSNPSQFKLRSGTVDLAVPESPAFSALGLTPQQVTRPSSGRELATSFLNGVDREGNFQTGVAIDAAPYMLLAGRQITLRKYQERGQFVTRFLTRWQMSFATSKGAGSVDKSVQVALGTRFTIFDRGDPRNDTTLLSCLEREGDKILTNRPPVSPMATEDEIEIENRNREEAVRSAVKPCREAAAARRWNRSAWIVGVAPTWTSPDGKASNVDFGGTALWSSIGYGFEGVPVLEDHATIIAYAKGRNKEVVPDSFREGSIVVQNNLTAGGRLLLGMATTQLNVEGLWVRNNRADQIEDRYWRVGVGFERQLVDNIWLSISFGREFTRRNSDNAFTVLGSFNWGFGEK